MEALTIEHIKQWRRWMEAHNYEHNAINSNLYRFRCIIRYFNKLKPLTLKPEDIIIPKMKKTIPKYLTLEQIDSLIKVAALREKAIIALLYSSGIRVGELVKLRRRDIYGDTLKIRGKGGKERMAFIDQRAHKYLTLYLNSRTDSNPFIFKSYRNRGLGTAQVQQLVRRLGVEAKLGVSVTPHILRHSFATHMAQRGCSAYHLQRILGHADISTTQIYVHLSGADLKEAYSKFHAI